MPTEEQIRAKAYELWLQRGSTSSDAVNWNDAIKALQTEQLKKQGFNPIKQLWVWTGFREKKLWDFMQLLLVPALLAIGGFWLNQQAAERQDVLNQQRREQDQQLANDKANQDTLVKYFDQMADSINNGLLRAEPGSEKFIVAQARTVVALQSSDRKRQQLIFQFLKASGLSRTSENTTAQELSPGDKVLLYQAQMGKAYLANSDLSGSVFIKANLSGAYFGCDPRSSRGFGYCSNLSGVDFRGSNLSGANLSDADLNRANLSGATLIGAYLGGTNLLAANLNRADLSSSILMDAKLIGANLSDADLNRAYLRRADLRFANLNRADFTYANLMGADLSDADLTRANLNNTLLFGANLSKAVLIATDLRYRAGLTQQQLEGDNAPLLCGVELAAGVRIDPNRDCDRIPEVLHNRHSTRFRSIEEAKKYVRNSQ